MSQPAPISCSEVWGGNRAAESGLELPGISGWVVSRPFHGEAEGGDVHYVSSCGTGRITRVMLADVSGHGQAVAGIGRKLRDVMQRYLNHEQPHRLAARLNRDMKKLAAGTGRFATALVITFFSPKGRLSICNAGHPTPLIYRAPRNGVAAREQESRKAGEQENVGERESLEQAEENSGGGWDTIDQPDLAKKISNMPLGVVEESGYVGRELTLGFGDMVLAYTDCLTEARAEGGAMLGEAGLLEVVRGLPAEVMAGSPGGLIEALLDAVEGRGYAMDDDLTAVVLRCTQRSHGAGVGAFFAGAWRVVKQLRHPRLLPWPDGLLR